MHRNQHPGRRPQFIGLPVPFNPDTGGFLRRASAALLLLACALALLLSDDGDVVQAQAPPLVSNTEQGSDESAGYSTSDHGQAFTTGYNATGYTVGGVIIISEDEEGDDTALKICGVGSNDSPTTTCTNLTAPSSFARGLLVFNAPTGTTLTLASRTTYMVVFNSPRGTDSGCGRHHQRRRKTPPHFRTGQFETCSSGTTEAPGKTAAEAERFASTSRAQPIQPPPLPPRRRTAR